MTDIFALWLPILVSTVLVFAASSVIHMAPLWHRNELPSPPDGDRMQDALRPFGLKPGEYMLPRAQSMKDCNAPGFVEKLKRGPVLLAAIDQTARYPWHAARAVVICIVVVTLLIACGGRDAGCRRDLPRGLRVAGTTAFIAYAAGCWPQSIWYHRPWSTTAKLTLDALIYGLLTGGAFGWLW
jgi:hypothetical protein